jgi:predicted 3-demethylubiquinone-9 3-methyltransferase (glyoxalase superfamily)
MTAFNQKIIPNLWYDREAEEAARFYISAFGNGKFGPVMRAIKAGYETHGLPEGTAMAVDFELAGMKFTAINGGPIFKFNPSISLVVACRTAAEVDDLWSKLSAGGTTLMELGAYPFSERFGWTQDKFGLSWKVMAAPDAESRQKITPSLMFVGPQAGNAEAAVRFYAAVFKKAKAGPILRYGKGEEPDREGTVKFATFTIEGVDFAAMDSALKHDFMFNEAVSFMVPCATQREIDYYWDKLTADGGSESMCGWLADKFGISWQISPTGLGEMLRDPDPRKVERVTNAFLKMKKFDLAELAKAYKGETP